jgi:hypothetical protein
MEVPVLLLQLLDVENERYSKVALVGFLTYHPFLLARIHLAWTMFEWNAFQTLEQQWNRVAS